jgi:thiol-disulfide isomerase/thioredoxin
MRSARSATVRCAAVLLVAAGLAGPGCSRSTSGGECAPLDTVVLPTPEGHAPRFQLPDVGCRTVRLDESNGRVRLIDFWATWCPPCKEEIPMLNELLRAYGDQGLTILAISDERPGVVREFETQVDMDYPNLIDTGAVGEAYGVVGLPTAFLVDQDGRIVDTYVGPKSRPRLEQQIRDLLQLPPTGAQAVAQ